MPQSRTLFGRPLETSLVAVDRAIAEFRAARPVLLRSGDHLVLALSPSSRMPTLSVASTILPAARPISP